MKLLSNIAAAIFNQHTVRVNFYVLMPCLGIFLLVASMTKDEESWMTFITPFFRTYLTVYAIEIAMVFIYMISKFFMTKKSKTTDVQDEIKA